MATLKFKTAHITILEGSLTCFGLEGYIANNGQWVLPQKQDEYYGHKNPLCHFNPKPIFGYLVEMVREDISHPERPQIWAILISPYTALRLWCEGKLTRDQLVNAENTESDIVTSIYIPIGGEENKRYTLIITKEATELMAYTIDKDEGIIH